MTTITRSSVATRRSAPPFDFVLVAATLLVSFVGVVMVYTATRGTLLAQGEDPKTFLKKQGLFVVLGVITMVVLAVFDYRRLEQDRRELGYRRGDREQPERRSVVRVDRDHGQRPEL